MKLVGIFGSPRREGNSDLLLEALLGEAEKSGASIVRVYASELKISPCTECSSCETTGKCIIEDDMQLVYEQLEDADAIVIATPIFFYHVPAQLKCLIDRAQALWARRRKHKAVDNAKNRKGYLIAIGATSGQKLFDGVRLTVKYFFDAIGAEYAGEVLVRGVEKKGDVLKHPDAMEEAKELAKRLLATGCNETV
ncbi:MAG: flavodoxin family protein [Armatimonadota bacterium]|nr:flavodoxin family protein [Armatimonadota bacterium]MCX7777238.1 flavodoxin family protein [Armatimonadota bacterium]MDW8024653.1 flavodoxin family protein [Armatimonadota bacterium]